MDSEPVKSKQVARQALAHPKPLLTEPAPKFKKHLRAINQLRNNQSWYEESGVLYKISGEIKKETSDSVDWHKIVGFRNIIAHNYFGIDAEEVWQIIHNSLIGLKIIVSDYVKYLCFMHSVLQ